MVNKKPLVFIYARVATAGQIDNDSLAHQLDACKQYCKDHGLVVTDTYSEVLSGHATKNPKSNFQAMLNRIKKAKRPAIITILRMDRIARGETLAELIKNLEAMQVKIHTVEHGEYKPNVLTLTMQLVFQKRERASVLAKMSRARAAIAAKAAPKSTKP